MFPKDFEHLHFELQRFKPVKMLMPGPANSWYCHERHIFRKELEHLRFELQQFSAVQELMLGASTVFSCSGAYPRVALGHVRVDVGGRVALLLVSLGLVRRNGRPFGSRIISPVAWNAMLFEERRLRTLLKCCLVYSSFRSGARSVSAIPRASRTSWQSSAQFVRHLRLGW